MNRSEQLYISSPGKPYVTPTIRLIAPTIATTAAPVPTDVVDGVDPKCGKYYHVVTGDYCNLIVIRLEITLQDFVFLNPSIDANCTNPLADESCCIQAVRDINTYSGRAGYITPAPTQGSATGKYNDLPDATYVMPTATATPVTLAEGTRADCNNYFDGDIFQDDVTGTNWKSKCELAAATYDVDLLDFGIWNTGLIGLGDVTLPTCSFTKGVQYCGKLYFGEAPDVTNVGPSLPIRFFAYNSAVKADFSGLWLGKEPKTLQFVDEIMT
ncbi:MAG: hypothetical protein Q9222_007811 [Ikaeria aurantiellina]